MKSIFLSLLSLCFFTGLRSQTVISGGSVFGTWTQANSPYLIQNAIMIPADSTLTIELGVTVQFQGNNKLWALGRLIAIGTPTDTIVFTCSNSSLGWIGVAYDNTTTSSDTSHFEYCKFEYSNSCAIGFSNISLGIVTHSRFHNCSSTGSAAIGYGKTKRISYCRFENNSSGSAGCVAGGFANISCEISYNTFIGNTCSGDYGGGI